MMSPRKRQRTDPNTQLIKVVNSLSAIDRETFDKRVTKVLKPLFSTLQIYWVPFQTKMPSVKNSFNLPISNSKGDVLAHIVLKGATQSFELTKDWSVYESVIAGLYSSAIQLSEAKGLAFIDDVTQLFNQRYLHLVLDKEIRRAERAKTPFSALFIDIDHFKNVNDSSGHLVGSKLLCQLSQILRQNIRIIDYGFRYGGDEFILLLIGIDKTVAHQVGERIRSQVENTIFAVDGDRVRLTLSIGVASFPEHAKSKEEIIKMADEAMYEGKNKSRNIVHVAG